MKILFAAGGTMGSVTPLLAVTPELQQRGHNILFVGTTFGPEQAVIEKAGLSFIAIPSTKLRRYMTWRHLLVPFEFAFALSKSLQVLRAEKPDVIVSAGSFVAVPLIWVARLRGIPVLLHQQDVVPTLSNVLCARGARQITTVFEESVKDFARYQSAERSVTWIGNPVRDLSVTTDTIRPLLDPQIPTVFIVGGGTGATGLNALVSERLCDIANVIHMTGKNKTGPAMQHARYHAFEFLVDEYMECLALADVVVSRAGIGSITELAACGKATVLVPMPHSHQEQNAALVARHKAALVLKQADLTPDSFAGTLQNLIADEAARQALSDAMRRLLPTNANAAFIDSIESYDNNQ